MARSKRSLDERIRDLRYELNDLKEQYAVQLYFETMPEYDPMYKYCYTTSSRDVPFEYQHIDYWIKAVIRHMDTRSTGHGGFSTSSVLVNVPVGLSDKGIDYWLSLTVEKLRKEAKKYGRRKN